MNNQRVLHAPRQTGKTTFLQSWMCEINAGSEALACYVSVERCQGVPESERAMPAICGAIREYAPRFHVAVPKLNDTSPLNMLNNHLNIVTVEMTAMPSFIITPPPPTKL
jgi:hypothetical protein